MDFDVDVFFLSLLRTEIYSYLEIFDVLAYLETCLHSCVLVPRTFYSSFSVAVGLCTFSDKFPDH